MLSYLFLSKDLIAADRGRVKTAVSMHSYSQMFLSAYGYTTDLPPEYPEMVHFKNLVEISTFKNSRWS